MKWWFMCDDHCACNWADTQYMVMTNEKLNNNLIAYFKATFFFRLVDLCLPAWRPYLPLTYRTQLYQMMGISVRRKKKKERGK